MFSKKLIIPHLIKRINYHTGNYTSISSFTPTAYSVYENSQYKNVDFKIGEDMPVKEALNKFTVLNIGCLAVTNTNKHVVGVISMHDYIHKVSVLDKDPNKLKIKDICIYNPNIIIAQPEDSLEICINKMLSKNIRHLLILDVKNDPYNYYKTPSDFAYGVQSLPGIFGYGVQSLQIVGIISMKDVIKEMFKNNKETICSDTDPYVY